MEYLKKQKFALLIDDITTFGGAEVATINLARILKDNGLDVVILSVYAKCNPPRLDLSDIEVISLDKKISSLVVWPHKYSTFPLALRGFFRYSRTRKYIKQVFIELTDISLINLLKEHKITTIIDNAYLQDYEKLISSFPSIKVIHGNFSTKKHQLELLKPYKKIVILSQKEIQTYKKHFDNICVASNYTPYQEKSASLQEGNRLLFVSRLVQGKRASLMIEIFASIKEELELKDLKLDILGDGELLASLKKQVNTLGLNSCVNFLGFQKNLDKYYLSSDIFCFTSESECLPMVLLEAASFGLPLVSFDIVSGPSDVIKHQENGFLIKDKDIKAYKQALKTLILDKQKRIQFGAKSKIIAKNFSKDVVFDKWQEILDLPFK